MKSKIIFATLLMFILINLACVSAIDNQTDDIGALDDASVTQDVLEVENTDDSYLQAESSNLTSDNTDVNDNILGSSDIQNSDEVLGESSYTFTQLNQLISRASAGSTVKLEHNYKYNPSSDSAFQRGVLIDKTLTINGQGHTIDGSGQAEIFFIENINIIITVNVKNVNFINAGGPSGTALDYSGYYPKGTVENCNFINNTGIMGAAIDFSCDGTVINCNFYNNTAIEGGAISAKDNLVVRNSVFVNNTASSENNGGGAIYYTYSSYSEQIYAKLYDCKFIGNSAKYGGVFYTVSRVRMTNCEAINNSATKGGVIYAYSYVDLINSTFKNNSAVSIGVVNSNQEVTISQSTFMDNHADKDSGVLRSAFGATIDQSTFINNTAGTDSGVGYINVDRNSDLWVTNCTFTNNSAKSSAGTLYVFGMGHFTDCKFTGNSASDTGGALKLSDDSWLTNCEFAANHVNGSGGAVHFGDVGELTNCTFTDNTATQSGGAAYINGRGTIKKSIFISNSAGDEGGAVLLKSSGSSTNSKFMENTAEIGGAISVYNTLTLSSTEFEDNSATTGVDNIALRESAKLSQSDANPEKFGPFRVLNFKILSILSNVNYGSDEIITIELISEGPIINNDTVFVVIDNKNYTAQVSGGTATLVIDDLECGLYSSYITDTNENYTKPQLNVEFNVVKKQICFDVANVTNIVYGDTEIITVTFDEKITDGTISIFLNDKNYSADVVEGTATLTIQNLTADDYTGYLIYDGRNYYADQEQIRFSVAKRDVFLAINVTNHTYGEVVEITVNVTADNGLINEGEVIFTFNNTRYVKPVADGIAELEIPKLNAGDYISEIRFNGQSNYKSKTKNATFSVAKKIVSIIVKSENITYGDKETITVNIVDDDGPVREGMVLLELNDKQYVGVVDNETITFEFLKLDANNYTCNVNYNGGDNYNNPTQISLFSVAKRDVDFSLNYTNITYGDVLRLSVNVTSNNTPVNVGNVIIQSGDKNYAAKVENGTAIVEIPDLDAGRFLANVTFNGGDNYYSKIQSISADVFIRIIDGFAVDFNNITYGDILKIGVNVISNNYTVLGGNVIIAVNGENYTAEVNDGFALIEIPNLDAGTYDANVSFDGGNNFNRVVEPVSFEVSQGIADVSFKVINTVYGDTLKVVVDVTSDDAPVNEGNVSIMINNGIFIAKVENGSAIIEIPNLNAGTYGGNITYSSDNYIKSEKPVMFDVLKRNVMISASDEAYVINYGGKYSLTVKGVAGEKVTFTLNGQNIGSAITDVNGVATISLTANLLKTAKSGTKNLVINLESTNYHATAKTVKITVNKEKAKLVAKKKTFKMAKKVKKYKMTLKNSKNKAVKNVKVTLKVKGKTYKAKTNAKGKATFKIKKLTKKGTFNAKITFKGNAYYEKVTKTAKIKIK